MSPPRVHMQPFLCHLQHLNQKTYLLDPSFKSATDLQATCEMRSTQQVLPIHCGFRVI